MALKYRIKTETVLDEDGSEIATVRGLSLNDIVGLLMVNKPAMDALFTEFKGRDPASITESDVNAIGIQMIESAPSLVAQIIAEATDAYPRDYVPAEGEHSPMELIMQMPAGLHLHMLEKIGRLTFEKGGSPKKLLAQVANLVGKSLSEPSQA